VIHFTLFMGILLIRTLKKENYLLTGLVLAACWYLKGYLNYGMYGVYLILLFYALIERPAASLLWVSLYMAWYGLPALRDRLYPLPDKINVSSQFYALLALPLIYIPMNSKLRINKWVFYLFYPAHLAVIYALGLIM
jgi:hypothetical protein